MKEFWKIRNEANEEAEILMYGEISDESWYGDEITPKKFAEDLKSLGGKAVHVRINSPGGDVFAAQAIYNQLISYAGSVKVSIDGICASAATIIACAGNNISMPDNAIFMIHNPKSALCGYYDENGAEQLRKRLEAVKQTIVNVYQKRCGDKLSEAEIKDLMTAETWMTAQEAQEKGFIDEILTGTAVKNSLTGSILMVNSVKCDISRFKNAAELQKIVNKQIQKESGNPMGNKVEDLLTQIKNLLTSNADNKNNAAVEQERQRIIDLEALNTDNDVVVASIVNTAKQNGKTAAEIKPYIDAVKNAVPAENKTLEAIKNLINDNLNSGAVNVNANPALPPNQKAKDDKNKQMQEIVDLINKQRG